MGVDPEYIKKMASNPRFKVFGGKQTPREKKPKYGAKKCQWMGKRFDSKHEMERYKQLYLMEKAGAISDLQTQVKFELIPKQNGEQPVCYIADFVYWQDGRCVVEDAKGVRTRDYIIKRKLMLQMYGIKIREV
jgi:hypothetical protein